MKGLNRNKLVLWTSLLLFVFLQSSDAFTHISITLQTISTLKFQGIDNAIGSSSYKSYKNTHIRSQAIISEALPNNDKKNSLQGFLESAKKRVANSVVAVVDNILPNGLEGMRKLSVNLLCLFCSIFMSLSGGLKPSLARSQSGSKSQISTADVISSPTTGSNTNSQHKHRAKVDIIVSDHVGTGKSPTNSVDGNAFAAINPNAYVQATTDPLKAIKQHNKKIEKLETHQLEVEKELFSEIESSWQGLTDSLQGAKLDTLIMLMATGAVIPLAKELGISPILGFMLAGTILGPNSLNWIQDLHIIDILGELGIVFFLFEMGLELSLNRLQKMRKDVFGLGTSQFILTSLIGAAISLICGLGPAAAVTIGGSLALSSSAFTLQLLKDKNAMGTRHGKASFGILLLQDLAVVPLLVVVELLAKGGNGLGKALWVAGVKALVALTSMSFFGRKLLNPIFSKVAKSGSQEAFLSIILTTVLLMSFITKGIGLSDTLGAFLAGILLSETSYRYQIESDIAPFRGLLLGFFFMTVGFSIDIKLLWTEGPIIASMLFALLTIKAGIITGLSRMFGIPFSSAQHTGLINACGGEFAFVSFGIAERMGLLPPRLVKMLLTTVALSMAATPALDEIGGKISSHLEKEQGYFHFVGEDLAAEEIKTEVLANNDFVIIVGYGKVGKMVCEMLDKRLLKYIAIDNSPQKAFEARSRDLPVFYGDIKRVEIMRKFKAGSASACVITIDNMTLVNKAIIQIRKEYPELPIIVRAKTNVHKQRLESMFKNITAISPVLPKDSMLLTLPFGGAVLKSFGTSRPEINSLLDEFRKKYMVDVLGEIGDEEDVGGEVPKGFMRLLTGFTTKEQPDPDTAAAVKLDGDWSGEWKDYAEVIPGDGVVKEWSSRRVTEDGSAESDLSGFEVGVGEVMSAALLEAISDSGASDVTAPDMEASADSQ